MVICFEGASAVGKTSVCNALAEAEEFTIIPEVNLMFTKPHEADNFWYYRKQIERYQKAISAPIHAILDGDPFQPLWYNWCYDFSVQSPNLHETSRFYRKAIEEQTLSFPDLYIIFSTTAKNLVLRKNQDTYRRRSNFEKHLKLIGPQEQYFRFINSRKEIPIKFIENQDFENCIEQTLRTIQSGRKKEVIDDLQELNAIVSWLIKNDPEDFD